MIVTYYEVGREVFSFEFVVATSLVLQRSVGEEELEVEVVVEVGENCEMDLV